MAPGCAPEAPASLHAGAAGLAGSGRRELVPGVNQASSHHDAAKAALASFPATQVDAAGCSHPHTACTPRPEQTARVPRTSTFAIGRPTADGHHTDVDQDGRHRS